MMSQQAKACSRTAPISKGKLPYAIGAHTMRLRIFEAHFEAVLE